MPERPIHIEIVDEEMARHLRTESGAERLRIASGLCASARRMLLSRLAAEHPNRDDARRGRETSRRLAGGRG